MLLFLLLLNILDEERKRAYVVQNSIENILHVRVDQVLQGHGTTNTGNVARRCFKNPELFATALELDVNLVKNIANIILLFKSKRALKLENIKVLCNDTIDLHNQLYPWAKMNPSLHKLLKHGCEVALKFPLPMAYFAEDAGESWHKIYRRNWTDHARQSSRANRTLDVFNRAVCLSDP